MEVWEESLPFKAEEAKEGSRYALRRRRRGRAAVDDDGTDERDDDDGAVAYFRGGAIFAGE